MLTHRLFIVVAVSLVALFLLAAPRFTQQPATASAQAQSSPEAREAAYRANNLGVALLEQFKHGEGAEQFRRALKLDPQLALAHINLAVALYNLPDADGAARAAADALALAPGAPQPLYIQALIARSRNQTDEALAAFRRVLQIDPRDTGANVNLGQLHAQGRNYAEAERAFRAALDSEPYNTTALYGLANVLLRSNRREEGQSLLQQFQILRQSGAGTSIGTNYLEQGRYAEAVTSTGAEAGLVERKTPEATFNDATATNLPAALPATAPAVAPKPGRPTRRAAAVPASQPRRRGGEPYEVLLDGQQSATRIFEQIGGGATLFDFDGDGDLDLFEVASTGQKLYRNDGGRFVDVTQASGALLSKSAGVGAVAGDYDNDTRPDLLVLRAGGIALYRNEGAGKFSDATIATGIAPYPHLSVSAAFADVDHDGDLDIFIAGHAGSSKPRLSAPRTTGNSGGDKLKTTGASPAPNRLLRNNGDGSFTDVTAAAKVGGGSESAVAVVPTDYDNRRDVDLLVVNYEGAPALYRNMRDGSFRDVAREVGLDVRGHFLCAAAGDVNKDGYTDFFFGAEGAAGVFALSDGRGRFNTSTAPAATMNSGVAQFLDYDNDGLLDLLTVAPNGLRVWRNLGDEWPEVSERAVAQALRGNNSQGKPGAFRRVLVSGDVDGDGDTDVMLRDASGGLRFGRNDGGNRNLSLAVRLAGRVSNRGGVESKVEMRAGSLWQKLEVYAAVPAPAPADLVFGLGRRERADAVRVLWPSGTVQSETEFAAAGVLGERPNSGEPRTTAAGTTTLTVTELDRKPSSCPYLYAWNGERFEFVTDFMGGGELGYWVAPGVRAAPDPDEYVRIRGDQLKPRDGRYELRVTNELEEVLFMDKLQLVAVSHPRGVEVYPGEGLGSPLAADFKLFATREAARPPRRAFDEHGHDVSARIARLDRTYPDDFALEPIRGYAAEHSLTLDLEQRDELRDEGGGMRDEMRDEGGGMRDESGDEVRDEVKDELRDEPRDEVKGKRVERKSRPAASRALIPHPSSLIPSPPPRTLLLLTGWTDYAFSSDNVAAAQRGLSLKPPALQVKDARGRWQTVIENIGIPVGRPQTVVVDLTGKFLSRRREVRIVTNMRIYWDQIRIDTSGAQSPTQPTRLAPIGADLRWRGFSAQASPDGREPYLYDYARVASTSPWKVFTGRYTREGDVRELVHAADDMFVVSRPGDELSLSFDATALAPLAPGWTRTFLLYADGYSKEMDINSASPYEVAPLPFRRMKKYPYKWPESYPRTPAHLDYLERYNTRVVGAPLPKIETMNAER
ncbi:MAG TPA: FG-GAP-like repeat-containing protein [Pyrinomonadaceae bacterium]|nr:FG-GAP-like repeat-containing protein [Pyrinomonadaceae bacterium]